MMKNNSNSTGGSLGRLSLEEALNFLEEGLLPQPSVEDVAHILHKCRKERHPAHALRLHAYMCKTGLEVHRSLGNYLVLMFVEVGSMHDAQQVFGKLVYRNEWSWNSLITGYVLCGKPQNALTLYQKMQEDDSLHPSAHTFVALLKACAQLKDLERGLKIHAHIARMGLLERDLFVASTLLDMYAKCGLLAKAQELFDKLLVQDVVSWNALIAGYAKHGHGEEALKRFELMQLKGVSPNAVTFVCCLKACGSVGAADKGCEIHAEIERKGLLERDLYVGSTLVDMYAKCGLLAKAQEVFDKLPVRNIVSWTALIAGYTEHGNGEEALKTFEKMQLEGVASNAVTLICSLKACGSIGAIDKGREIHSEIERKGLLETNLLVGNALVDMYAKCGFLAKAEQVFDKLPVRNVVSWNALIIGCAEHGHGEKALKCFEQMQLEGVLPNAVTFVCSLKSCGSIGATDKGQELHAQIATEEFLERDLVVGTTLVDMYAKCGSLAKAQQVFDKLPVRNIVLWNALTVGYAKHGYGERALKCFEQMQLEGVSPDAVMFTCSLKACGSIGATDKGLEIHVEIERKGLLESDLVVGNALVDMYAKCGWLAEAQKVFDKLLVRDVISWNALIAGYTELGHGEEALKCFEQMQHEGMFPNAVTFLCSLKACGNIGATDKGCEIHAEIARKGLLEGDLVVGSTLVDMYVKCGLLVKAQEVFDNFPVQNVVSWKALIAGYVEHGHGDEALDCFKRMQLEGVSPDLFSIIYSLKACCSIGITDKGREIHAEIARKGLLEKDIVVGNTLVDMYATCGSLAEAQEVFNELPFQNVVSWNTLIAGYAKHGRGEEALQGFEQMQLEGVSPNAITFVSSLKASGCVGATEKGHKIHAEIEKRGFWEKDVVVCTALVDMYAKCGSVAEAQQVFDKLPVRDLVSWNALISGYSEHVHGEETLKCFEKMQLEGFSPNVVTFVCTLKACGSIRAIDKGQEIHAVIARRGLLERDLVVGNTLVDMYAKCGSLAKAQEVFDKLLVRDVVSWTSLMTGYAQHGHGEKALNCLEKMQLEGVSPNSVTFICSLKACGSLGATDKGQGIHAEIERKGLLERDHVVGTSLMDMYVKCGSLMIAEQVFDKLPVQGVVSWNSLIAGYCQLGESENVFRIFDRMLEEGIRPDSATFVIVLNACSQTVLFDKGQTYFQAMSSDYGIIPTLEHHTCMVDLLGRAGQLDKAVAMIKKLPLCPDIAVWHSVLDACRKWGNVELGRQAFQHAVRLDGMDSTAFVLMSNIYAGAYMQEKVNKVEVMRVELQA